jgi:hypothetical protein
MLVMHVMTVHVCTYLIMLSSFPLVRVSSARIKSTSLELDGSKGHVFEISYWCGTI